jgi:hypothetical protein
VRDSNGQQLAYIYFEDDPGRRSAAKLKIRRRISIRDLIREIFLAMSQSPP